MYANTGYKIKIGENASPLFYGSNGLKQGCCMSPTLSSIYQNDLHEIFVNENCDPIQLGDVAMNSISWADDLIVMSLSRNGLQKCLDKLENYCNKWGLEVNVKKTKAMVMSKRNVFCEPVCINNIPVDFVTNITYLGFQISSNGNVQSLLNDRAAKASRVAHMVLQAISTNRNVSVKLALSIFDKQILPILLYGSAIWAFTRTHNLLYIENQPEVDNTRTIVSEIFTSILNRQVPIEYARRVGKRTENGHRRILVKLTSYADKEILMRHANEASLCNFDEKEHDMEKVQNDFCKKAMNISKYASNTAILGELGRMPVVNTAKSMIVKYWLRMHHGTKHVLLNEAYKVNITHDLTWYQGVQYILKNNGFGDVWVNPSSVDLHCFHKVLRQRLNDQHMQNWRNKFNVSRRFQTLQILQPSFDMQKYILIIKDPQVREIFTRLRVDMNILSTCKTRTDSVNNVSCPLCKEGCETVHHFLFNCKLFEDSRKDFFHNIIENDRNFEGMSQANRLKYVLNLECPNINIGLCCKYVTGLYTRREGYTE